MSLSSTSILSLQYCKWYFRVLPKMYIVNWTKVSTKLQILFVCPLLKCTLFSLHYSCLSYLKRCTFMFILSCTSVFFFYIGQYYFEVFHYFKILRYYFKKQSFQILSRYFKKNFPTKIRADYLHTPAALFSLLYPCLHSFAAPCHHQHGCTHIHAQMCLSISSCLLAFLTSSLLLFPPPLPLSCFPLSVSQTGCP